MRLTIEFTDFQLRVVRRLMAEAGTGFGELLAQAIAFDAAHPVPARWREPRPRPPRRRGPGRRPSRGEAGSAAAQPTFSAVLAAATGRAIALAPGDRLTIEQLADGQCVDLAARELGAGRPLSAARTRSQHGIHPTTGDLLWSAPPEVPLLRIHADTAPGHDLCFPPCSPFEYEELTGIPGHRGCHELLAAATRQWFAQHAPAAPGGPSIAGAETTDVLNLWLPSEVGEDGTLRSWPVACRRGDRVEFEAVVDVLVTLSTCPDDLYGSAQFAPGAVAIRVQQARGARIRASRPMVSPRSALVRHSLSATVPAELVAHLDRVRAGEWLGTTRPAVARALLLRWYEAERVRTQASSCSSVASSP